MAEKTGFNFSLSINCFDVMHLGDVLAAMNEQNVSELLFPIGDGEIAPFMAGLDMVRQVSAQTTIPCHALLLARHPERHIDACATAGCSTMTISLEASTHQHRILSGIRGAGMKSGIAINPATSLISLDYLLEKADRVCLLGIEPGNDNKEKATPALVERVKLLTENLRYRELRTQIMTYSGINIALAGRVLTAGISVLGIEPEMLWETGESSTLDAFKKCVAMLQTA